MSQIEQEQLMHGKIFEIYLVENTLGHAHRRHLTCPGTAAGQVSLRVLAQVQKASEDLEAFVSSCEDMRLDIEQNLDKISLVSKPSGPKSLSAGHALDKWKVGRRVRLNARDDLQSGNY